jgi:hypothetical protein
MEFDGKHKNAATKYRFKGVVNVKEAVLTTAADDIVKQKWCSATGFDQIIKEATVDKEKKKEDEIKRKLRQEEEELLQDDAAHYEDEDVAAAVTA